jgi:outer membrane protein assembly factor BamD
VTDSIAASRAPLRQHISRLAFGLGLCLGLTALAACSSNKGDDLVLDETPADVLYNQGLASMDKGKSSDALKKFEDVDRLHPYTESAKKSILMQAFTQYQRGAYTDAIQAARRFITVYPGSPDAPYAQYLIAESYFAQMTDVSRDQEMAKRAADAYRELIQKFPDSRYTEDSRRKLIQAEDQLAGKEMEIGRYYIAKRQFIPAINRFKVVVTNYQTTRHIEEALARLVEAYMALGVTSEAQTAAAILGHNYPDSPWYKDSYTLLKQGGYEPGVSQDSWMAKAMKTVKIF